MIEIIICFLGLLFLPFLIIASKHDNIFYIAALVVSFFVWFIAIKTAMYAFWLHKLNK